MLGRCYGPHQLRPKLWPYSGKKVYVLLSTPLPDDVPEGVIGVSGAIVGLVEQLRSADLAGDAHLLGGSKIIQGFLKRRAENASAIPDQALRLLRQNSFPDGAIDLIYVPQ